MNDLSVGFFVCLIIGFIIGNLIGDMIGDMIGCLIRAWLWKDEKKFWKDEGE